jgi:hypothetical protein
MLVSGAICYVETGLQELAGFLKRHCGSSCCKKLTFKRENKPFSYKDIAAAVKASQADAANNLGKRAASMTLLRAIQL